MSWRPHANRLPLYLDLPVEFISNIDLCRNEEIGVKRRWQYVFIQTIQSFLSCSSLSSVNSTHPDWVYTTTSLVTSQRTSYAWRAGRSFSAIVPDLKAPTNHPLATVQGLVVVQDLVEVMVSVVPGLEEVSVLEVSDLAEIHNLAKCYSSSLTNCLTTTPK